MNGLKWHTFIWNVACQLSLDYACDNGKLNSHRSCSVNFDFKMLRYLHKYQSVCNIQFFNGLKWHTSMWYEACQLLLD